MHKVLLCPPLSFRRLATLSPRRSRGRRDGGRRNLYRIFTPTLFIFFFPVLALAKPQVCPKLSAENFLGLAIERSDQAKLATDLRQKAKLAKEGMRWASLCLQEEPASVPCTYYRAVNRGLELQTRTFKIKSGLEKIMRDFEFVIARDPDYDHGGAYVAIGSVYLKSPTLTAMGDFSRDLSKAKDFATKALQISPTYPLNHRLAGEVALEQKDYKTALRHFKSALKGLAHFKHTLVDHAQEKKELAKLLKKTKKKISRRPLRGLLEMTKE